MGRKEVFSRKLKRKRIQRPSNQMVRRKGGRTTNPEYTIKFHFKPISDTFFDHSVAVSFTMNLLNARYNIIIFDFGCSFRSLFIGSLFGLLTAFNRTIEIEFFYFISSWYFFFNFSLWPVYTLHIYNFQWICFVLFLHSKRKRQFHKSDGMVEKNSDQLNSFNEQVGNNKRLINKTIFFILVRLSIVENNNNNSIEINTVGSLHNHFQCLLHRIEENKWHPKNKKNQKFIMKCGKELFIRFHEWFAQSFRHVWHQWAFCGFLLNY